jgi:hypothetical protein
MICLVILIMILCITMVILLIYNMYLDTHLYEYGMGIVTLLSLILVLLAIKQK